MIKEIELHFDELTNSMESIKNAINEVVKQENKMITEIKVGDYIEKSELDTEQKYNDVVAVFEQWGFSRNGECALPYFEFMSHDRERALIASKLTDFNGLLMGCDLDDEEIQRKLTYDQVMSLKKVDVDNCNVDKLVSNRVSIVNRDLEGQMQGNKQSISVQYLNRCKAVQTERGKQYDSKGTGERSFDAAAQAFNSLTGEKLSGSDVCLLLTCLKVVRQNSDKSRIHDDSLLDGISYLSLWAEELTKELNPN